jgi:AraC-like DNA-binding protein
VGDHDRVGAALHRFSVGQFDELQHLAQRLYYPCRWQAPESVRRLPVEFTAVTLGGITIGAVRTPGDVSVFSVERDSYLVSMAVNGGVDSEFRGTRVRVNPTTAAVHQPSGPGLVRWNGRGDELLGIKIDRAVLESALQTQLGRPVRRPVDLAASMDTIGGLGRAWAGLVRLIYHDANAESPLFGNPLVDSRLQDAVVLGLLAAVDHPYRQHLLTPATPGPPRRVKRAIDLMEAHPDQPMSATGLAGMIGVSVRTLQDGFRKHVGVTPMAYLRQVRLARAREDLRQADPRRQTVAAVAYRWGFTHLGRFAAAYRARYGQSPSRTLRERR